MPNEPEKCPLCGGAKAIIRNWPPDKPPIFRCAELPPCGLEGRHWPRVAELVAIRDAVVKREAAWMNFRDATARPYIDANEELRTLARAEIKRQEEKHGDTTD